MSPLSHMSAHFEHIQAIANKKAHFDGPVAGPACMYIHLVEGRESEAGALLDGLGEKALCQR